MKTLTRFFQTRSAAHLAVLAALSGLIYALIFTLPFPLARLYTTIPPVDYAKLTRHTPAGLFAYILGIGLLFALYLRAVQLAAPGGRAVPRRQPALRSILAASAGLALVSIPAYPLTAIDLFIYAIRTRGWALYSLNPLATAPEQLPAADHWLGLAGEWVDAASPYGPVWEWLSLGAFYLSGGSFLAHLLALKILAGLAYLGCVWLVYLILTRLRPEWAFAGTLAFAWNPLVLLESIQNGHNDIVMSFFLLAAVWALVQIRAQPHSRFGLSLLFCLLLALSVLVKFVTVIVAPFLLAAAAWQQPAWPRRFAAAGLLATGVAAPVLMLMWPLWPGLENWAVLAAGGQAGRSLLALLVLGLKDRLGLSVAFDVSRNLIWGLMALIYLYYLRQTLTALLRAGTNAGGVSRPVAASLFVLFWYVLLAAPVFHAWYLLWFLPLAPLLLPQQRPFRAVAIFSVTALLIIPYFETIRVWYPALLNNQLLGHLVGVPLLIGPPAIAALWPISPPANSEV